MTYTFECKSCGACGCGVTLYDANGKVVGKATFQSTPTTLYCADHVPVKPKVSAKIT